MATICNRKNKLIQNPAELSDEEVYIRLDSTDKNLYVNISDVSFRKQASDPWKHKKSVETIESYADHFEYKTPGLRIRRDFPMATMKDFKKPKKNYLTDFQSKKDKQSNVPSNKLDYFPIEVLRYASLNQTDSQLIYKLPSILVRISQLYYIEQFRKLLADNIQCYSV